MSIVWFSAVAACLVAAPLGESLHASDMNARDSLKLGMAKVEGSQYGVNVSAVPTLVEQNQLVRVFGVDFVLLI